MTSLSFLIFNLIALLFFFIVQRGYIDLLIDQATKAMALFLRAIRPLFPLMDEVSVFTIAASFLLIDFFDASLAPEKTSILYLYIDHIRSYALADSHSIEGVLANIAFMGIIFPLFAFGPLLVPFTRWDMRTICIPFIMLDAVLVAVANIIFPQEHQSTLNLFFAYYAGAWPIYLLLVLIHPDLKTAETAMHPEQANRCLPIIGAIIACVGIEILVRKFHWHWLHAYSLATLSACYAVSAFRTLTRRVTARKIRPKQAPPITLLVRPAKSETDRRKTTTTDQ